MQLEVHMKRLAQFAVSVLLLSAFTGRLGSATAVPANYLDYSDRADALSGGVRLITVDTPKGEFRVWTKRVGNNPTIKMLLLHGGPGFTHEYLEAVDSYFPAAGIEYY